MAGTVARASATAVHTVAKLFSVALFMGGPPSMHSDGPINADHIAMFLSQQRQFVRINALDRLHPITPARCSRVSSCSADRALGVTGRRQAGGGPKLKTAVA